MTFGMTQERHRQFGGWATTVMTFGQERMERAWWHTAHVHRHPLCLCKAVSCGGKHAKLCQETAFKAWISCYLAV